MAKILNIRERVHQPFRDALIRAAGLTPGNLGSTNDLFIAQGRDEGPTSTEAPMVKPRSGPTLPINRSVFE